MRRAYKFRAYSMQPPERRALRPSAERCDLCHATAARRQSSHEELLIHIATRFNG